MSRCAISIWVLCFGAVLLGQEPEFDFYPENRDVLIPNIRAANPSATNDQLLKEYADALAADGIGSKEIGRRLGLIRDNRAGLEVDYWNRVYTSEESHFNRAPNAFLMEVVQDLDTGVALDYSMGEGRNSIYLAQLGWEVWGFDPADAAVALAGKRARELGLTLHVSAVRDDEFEFGRERFDLIVFSWAMPLSPVETVLASLKPGGAVVMEAAADYVGRNGMLKKFDALRIVRYEVVRDRADWYGRRETEIVRLVATKP